ncbi:protein ECT2 isoform X2 [Cimex lectularius]|uniref:Pebble n=1 Tax=Cimex lectularius TaxID=79782 RepID=A0A8I6RGF9_CIMLE|nr:protein ECT2 isoform X2 [Cimex lectularius]
MDDPAETRRQMECSDVDEDSAKIDVPDEGARICVIGNLSNDESVLEAARAFNVPVETSLDGSEWIDSAVYCTVFVLEEFSGPVFDRLKERGHRILGPTALKELSKDNASLPDNPRPLYSTSMKGVVVCFTGFRKKEELARLILLIHNMGGSIRKEMIGKVTHLIANCCGGEKYQYAVAFRVPIMSSEWVYNSWAMRAQIGYNAHQNGLAEHKLKPFHGARVCFLGFPEEERKHMADILVENGGVPTDIQDPLCSHVVLDSAETYDVLQKDYKYLTKRRRCGSELSPTHNLELSIQDPHSCSTPKTLVTNVTSDVHHEKSVVTAELTEAIEVLSQDQEENISPNSDIKCPIQAKRFKMSPCPEKLHFKTPTRLNIVRRSLRFKTSSVLSKWISSLDVSMGAKTDPPPQVNEQGKDPPNQTEVKEEYGMNSMVVDESTTTTAPSQASSKAHVVKAEWFWMSVQNQGCMAEIDHFFQEYVGRVTPGLSIGSTPGSSVRARKRKRLRGCRLPGSSSPALTSPILEPVKRRSSITDATLLSCSGSFLDASPHPDLEEETEAEGPETPRKNLSARHQVFLELLQTESNYVGILNTIMNLFKAPLEEMLEGEDQLLNATELKIIFGNLPPIYHTHSCMLEELRHAAHNWKEDVSIGNIFRKYATDLVKAYPPFVNFFENTREMLIKCDESKPRFHAFLKARQTRAECGRQSLQELLIRPVQRLPSISLLLSDMLKHTSKSNLDHSALESALSSIREVMTHINEDKRKTEGQMVMFDIFNEIDNCPPHLVSSHRNFIFRCDVIELSDGLSGRGDPLVLYVFSDVVEICKRRSKAFNSLKSPNTNITGKLTNGKPYKHIKLMPLSTIKRVIDIKETDDCHKVFALMCRSTQDLKEKLYSFKITDDEVEKMSFLKTLCRQTAYNACRADAENFLASLDPQTLDIETSDVGLGTLGKAFKFATRTRLKVGRALSFNKTPSKLKRAMSTMMSPFGSTTNLTPATQLAQMRLASCTNINELANSSPPAPQYVAPMSVQPTRRSKHSSLGVSSLRRL